MDEIDIFYCITVHVTGALADELNKRGFGYKVPIQSPVSVEPEPGADIWEMLGSVPPVALSAFKTQTVADVSIVLGNLDVGTNFYRVEVWALANAATLANENGMIGSGQVSADVMEARDFNLVDAFLARTFKELSHRIPTGAAIDAHIRRSLLPLRTPGRG